MPHVSALVTENGWDLDLDKPVLTAAVSDDTGYSGTVPGIPVTFNGLQVIVIGQIKSAIVDDYASRSVTIGNSDIMLHGGVL